MIVAVPLDPETKQDGDRIRLNSVSLRFRNLKGKGIFHFQVYQKAVL